MSTSVAPSAAQRHEHAIPNECVCVCVLLLSLLLSYIINAHIFIRTCRHTHPPTPTHHRLRNAMIAPKLTLSLAVYGYAGVDRDVSPRANKKRGGGGGFLSVSFWIVLARRTMADRTVCGRAAAVPQEVVR